ncbi:transposase [Streptococcus pneumoniae]|nr:transposase [Streptococcus pneumoniae]
MGKSYKEIIELLDCNQTTIWRNVKKYEEFGLDSLLQETRGGRNHAYMTVVLFRLMGKSYKEIIELL